MGRGGKTAALVIGGMPRGGPVNQLIVLVVAPGMATVPEDSPSNQAKKKDEGPTGDPSPP